MENRDEKLRRLEIEALDYISKGEIDRAIAAYTQMLQDYKDRDDACEIAYCNLGVIYLKEQKLSEAEENLKKALSCSPLQMKYHQMLGLVYIQSKQPLDAVKEFKVCLKQEPNNSKCLIGLSVALFDAGKKTEAQEVLSRVDSLAADASRILAVQAAAYLREGDSKKALKMAEDAKFADPFNVKAKNLIKTIHKMQLDHITAKSSGISSPFCTYQLKMVLKGISPPIWRRFQVSGNISLYKLHLVLQAVMGWENYHLFEFQMGDLRFGIPDPEEYHDVKDARRYKLNKVLPAEKTRLMYTYDFGDGWEHELTVEKIIPVESELKHPVCLGGKRAGPPEDSGGVGGYEDYLKILRTPLAADPDDEDEEIKSRREWIGEKYDAEYFNLEEINQDLSKIK